MPITQGTTLALVFMLTAIFSSAQTQTLSLNSAIDAAMKNNLSIKTVNAETEYFRQLKSTASSIPKTDVSLMYGQYNGFYKKDNNISVSQTIPFPSLLVAKGQMYEAQKKGGEMKSSFTKNEIAFRVKQTYIHLNYLYQYKSELQKLDSIFSVTANAASLKYKAGENTLLEQTSALTKKEETANKLRGIDNEIEIYLQQLKTLTGISSQITIEKEKLSAKDFAALTDTNAVKNNPRLNYFRQQIEIAAKQKSVTANANLPDIKLGYFNQSLYGVPLDNTNLVFAGTRNRFSGFQVGLGIPLWFVPEASKTKADKQQIEVARFNFLAEEQNAKSLFQQTVQEYVRAKNSLGYFNNVALKNAELINKQSSTAYSKGEINLSEHLLNLQLAMQVKEGYLQTLHDLNQSVIYLEFLTSK